MAGEGETAGRRPAKAPSSQVETRVGRAPAQSIELGLETKPVVKTSAGEGFTVDNAGDGTARTHASDKSPKERAARPAKKGPDAELEEDADTEGEVEGDDADSAEGEGEGEAEGEEAGEGVALPEFDAEDEGVVAEYEAAYTTEQGAPDADRLSQAWWASAKRNEETGEWEGSLPEGAYQFLETKGLSKASVKAIEAGQVALQVIKEQRVIARAGSAEDLNAALTWARGDGYTPAQKARYMAAINGGDQDAIDEQVDVLMSRFRKTNPPARRTQVRPTRTVATAGGGSSSGAGGTQPFADYAEYSTTLRAARNANNGKGDQRAYDLARARLRVSPWYGGARKK